MPPRRNPREQSAKAALAALAESDLIDRAEAGLDDLELAAEFVERVGLDRLGAAVAVAEGDRRVRGATVLAAYLRFRAAAAGVDVRSHHFHRARGTHLRRRGERSNR